MLDVLEVVWASGSSVQSKVIDMVIVEVQNGPLVL